MLNCVEISKNSIALEYRTPLIYLIKGFLAPEYRIEISAGEPDGAGDYGYTFKAVRL